MKHPWTKCYAIGQRRRMVFGRWLTVFRCPKCKIAESRAAVSAECNGISMRKGLKGWKKEQEL